MIDFVTLAPKQEQLDAHIRKKQGLEDQDLLLNTIFALQVEVAELANEVRFFKHWSKDQEPRTAQYYFKDAYGRWDPVSEKYWRMTYGDPEDKDLEGERWKVRNPVLEEYADCLHFFLSIGNMLNVNWQALNNMSASKTGFIEIKFAMMNKYLADCWWNYHDNKMGEGFLWTEALSQFMDLGLLLGFDDEQVTAAYLEKNKINYERQANGY